MPLFLRVIVCEVISWFFLRARRTMWHATVCVCIDSDTIFEECAILKWINATFLNQSKQYILFMLFILRIVATLGVGIAKLHILFLIISVDHVTWNGFAIDMCIPLLRTYFKAILNEIFQMACLTQHIEQISIQNRINSILARSLCSIHPQAIIMIGDFLISTLQELQRSSWFQLIPYFHHFASLGTTSMMIMVRVQFNFISFSRNSGGEVWQFDQHFLSLDGFLANGVWANECAKYAHRVYVRVWVYLQINPSRKFTLAWTDKTQ